MSEYMERNAVSRLLGAPPGYVGYEEGGQLTEADIRLWTTLIRFDHVYHTHFKCNRRRIADYPNLAALTRRLYELDGVAETVNFKHIRHHYYESHEHINPNGIVPPGPRPEVPGLEDTGVTA